MKLIGLKQFIITGLFTVIPFGLVSAQTSKPATKKHTSIQEDPIAYNKVIPRIMNVVDSAALKNRNITNTPLLIFTEITGIQNG